MASTSLLSSSPHHAHHPSMGGGSTPGSVAAPHLAVHDGWTDGLFGPPVGCGKIVHYRHPLGVLEVTGTKRLGEQLAYSPGRASCPGRQIAGELVAATEEVGEAALVGCLLEAAIGSPALSDHHAGVLR